MVFNRVGKELMNLSKRRMWPANRIAQAAVLFVVLTGLVAGLLYQPPSFVEAVYSSPADTTGHFYFSRHGDDYAEQRSFRFLVREGENRHRARLPDWAQDRLRLDLGVAPGVYTLTSLNLTRDGHVRTLDAATLLRGLLNSNSHTAVDQIDGGLRVRSIEPSASLILALPQDMTGPSPLPRRLIIGLAAATLGGLGALAVALSWPWLAVQAKKAFNTTRECPQHRPASHKSLSYDGIHLLRILACFMVIVIHVSSNWTNPSTQNWTIALTYDFWAHASIPLFMMISGYLLLDKHEDALTFYRKRLSKIAVPVLFFSVIYMAKKQVPPREYIYSILNGPVEIHLWYVYVLVGVYLFIPFLRLIFLNSSIRDRLIFLLAWLTLSVLYPVIKASYNLTYNPIVVFNLGPFTGYLGYVFLGGCLKSLNLNNKSLLLLGSVASLMIAVFLSHIYSQQFNRFASVIGGYFSFLTLTSAVFIFCATKDSRLNFTKTIVHHVSGCTFGIYLVHILVLEYFFKHVSFVREGSILYTIPLISICCFIVSYVIIAFFRKIFFLRILVG